jgi:glutamate dehydrogenase/leucine dehydrogenase
VADLATGYGVSRAAARILAGEDARRPDCLEGVRVVVEGFGNVGGPAALYLARLGARVVGIVDAASGIRVDGGLDAAGVEDLIQRRAVREIPEHPDRVVGVEREEVYSTPADLFIPAAVSGSLDPARLSQLHGAGVETIVSGANQPVQETCLGETGNLEAADGDFRMVADVVGSMGMARAFHHLMADGPAGSAEEIFEAVRFTMEEAVSDIVHRHGPGERGLVATALNLALDRIGFPE